MVIHRQLPVAFMLVFFGAWGLLIVHLSREWWNNSQYGYGFFVPVLCAWVLWQRRGEVAEGFTHATSSSGYSWLGRILLLMGALALLPIELLRQVSPQLRSIGILGTLFCLSLTFWTLRQLGLRRMPDVLPGTALLFVTAIPWPTALEVWITQSLMKGVAAMTTDVLNLFGILAIHRGNLIELASGVVSINEACSGVRSIQSCLMASVALSQFFRLRWSKVWLMLICGMVLALVGNFLRTLTLTLIAALSGPARLESLHDPAGWTILVAVTVVLYWVAGKLEGSSLPPSISLHSIDWNRLPRARAICAVGIASVITAHLWYWCHDAYWPSLNEPFLVLKSSPELPIQEVTVPPAIMEILQPQRGAFHQGYSSTRGEIAIYSFFWLPGTDQLAPFFHRPDVCMTGVGWEMSDEVRKVSVRIGDRDVVWRIFSFRRGGQKILQAWGVWRDEVEQELDFSTGWRSIFGQHKQRWQYVWQGRRRANTQIVSVSLDVRFGDEKALCEVIQQLFEIRR